VPFLLLLSVVLSGCGVLNTLTGSSNSSSGKSVTPGPSGTPWIVTAQGSATPSPVPSYPTGSPTVYPSGFLALPTSTVTYPTPRATCSPATYDFAIINALSVTTGTTSGVASWYNIGGYNLVQFRMTAISQDVVKGKQRDIGWVTLTPTAPCGQITMTVKGLDRKTHYVFEVDAVVTRRSGDGTHGATVFRSGPVLTK
jgi:hypothetical protein